MADRQPENFLTPTEKQRLRAKEKSALRRRRLDGNDRQDPTTPKHTPSPSHIAAPPDVPAAPRNRRGISALAVTVCTISFAIFALFYVAPLADYLGSTTPPVPASWLDARRRVYNLSSISSDMDLSVMRGDIATAADSFFSMLDTVPGDEERVARHVYADLLPRLSMAGGGGKAKAILAVVGWAKAKAILAVAWLEAQLNWHGWTRGSAVESAPRGTGCDSYRALGNAANETADQAKRVVEHLAKVVALAEGMKSALSGAYSEIKESSSSLESSAKATFTGTPTRLKTSGELAQLGTEAQGYNRHVEAANAAAQVVKRQRSRWEELERSLKYSGESVSAWLDGDCGNLSTESAFKAARRQICDDLRSLFPQTASHEACDRV